MVEFKEYLNHISSILGKVLAINFCLLVTLFILYIGFFALVSYLTSEKTGLNNAKDEFFVKAEGYLNNYASDSPEYLVGLKNTFESVDREYDRILTKYGYKNLLQDYIALLSTRTENSKYAKKALIKINRIIQLDDEKVPFKNLHPDDRDVMNEIYNAIKTEDFEYANKALFDLYKILEKNFKDRKKMKEALIESDITKWFGLAFTVFFGFLTVYFYFNPRKS